MQIFSLLMQLFMGHIVSCLHLLKKRIFFLHVYPQLSFFFKKTWFVSFYLSPPLLFFPKTVFPKTCFVFPIFIGGEVFFNPLLFIGGVVSILYRAGFFCFLDSLFSLDFCCVCFLFALCLSYLCQYVTKRGRFR